MSKWRAGLLYIISNWLLIVLVALLLLIHLRFGLTFTFDSAKYLSLANVVSSGNWVAWDRIRGPSFPFLIFLTQSFFGDSEGSLLIPMLVGEIIIFAISCFFLYESTNSKNGIIKNLVFLSVFIVVMIDPLIFGYSHSLLTESYAVVIAFISCYFGYKMVIHSRNGTTSQKVIPYIYFALAIPFSWHLKQPYIGSSLFPFIISILIIIMNEKRKAKLFEMIKVSLIIGAMLMLSIFAWRFFLYVNGTPDQPKREISWFLKNQKPITILGQDTPQSNFFLASINNYLAYSNIYYFDQSTETIDKRISFARSAENKLIAYRLFDQSGKLANTFYVDPELEPNIVKYKHYYTSPKWLINLFSARLNFTDMLFSILNILMPLLLLLSLLLNERNSSNILLFQICAGAGFLNSLAHTLIIRFPIDRYFFWGYPLYLVSLLILISYLLSLLGTKKQKNLFMETHVNL